MIVDTKLMMFNPRWGIIVESVQLYLTITVSEMSTKGEDMWVQIVVKMDGR
jgi:hypothetical protein